MQTPDLSRADDRRAVLTLDAGGTNFAFSAMLGGRPAIDPIVLPADTADLGRCLSAITRGFDAALAALGAPASAISFAFPGPCDYPRGIVGDLGNLPCFRGGVPLGDMLADRYGVPVFINNDGDLFAYGEAIGGLLPQANALLAAAGSPRRYRNLLGVTLGTGFGGGLSIDGRLLVGDNSAGAEVWLLSTRLSGGAFAEEQLSIRALVRSYKELSGDAADITPRQMSLIVDGQARGDARAAAESFARFGDALGEALANAVTITDSLVAVGGGLSNAYRHFAPAMFARMNGTIPGLSGGQVARMEVRACDLESDAGRADFTGGRPARVAVPGSGRMVDYDPDKRVGVGRSRLGTENAVALGAYAFALAKLDETK